MPDPLLLVGVVVAALVGINIGGSTTGVAFGPAVGCGAVSKLAAGALMTTFAFAGGVTVGRNVVQTLGEGLVQNDPFTTTTALAALLLIGGVMTLSNLSGIPVSTSMTAVGVIAGFGVATGTLAVPVLVRIVAGTVISVILAFWTSAVFGRYCYAPFVDTVPFEQSDGALFRLDRAQTVPRLRLAAGTTRGEVAGVALVIVIACIMAFGAGANNVANVVAPLVGTDLISLWDGLLLASATMGIGAFTLAQRTLDTVSTDLTDISLPAGVVVAFVSATISIALSWFGIPASFVVIAIMSIVGLGWGRAARVNEGAAAAADEDLGDLYDRTRIARVLATQFGLPLFVMTVTVIAIRLTALLTDVAPTI